MQQAKGIISLYVPPDPQRMQKAFEAHNVSLVPGGGAAQLVFKNYAQPGDQMTIAFDIATKKIQTLKVNSYVGDPKDAISFSRDLRQPARRNQLRGANRSQFPVQGGSGHDHRLAIQQDIAIRKPRLAVRFSLGGPHSSLVCLGGSCDSKLEARNLTFTFLSKVPSP